MTVIAPFFFRASFGTLRRVKNDRRGRGIDRESAALHLGTPHELQKYLIILLSVLDVLSTQRPRDAPKGYVVAAAHGEAAPHCREPSSL